MQKGTKELASVEQDPLFLVFLDLSKAKNTVDLGHLISDMEGYDAGPQMCELLSNFWVHQEVFTRQNDFHSANFKAAWWTIQGGIISPTLFNVVLDNLVWTWMTITVEDQIVA